MKKIFKKKLWETLALTFAIVMMIMSVASQAIVIFANEIHGFLGTTDYKEVKLELRDGETEKIIDRKALKTAQEIEEYYRNVNVEVEGEGLVLLKNENNALPLTDGTDVAFALGGSAKIFYATHGPGVRRDGEKAGAFYDLKRAIEEDTSLKINSKIYQFLKDGKGKAARGQSAGTFLVNEASWSDYTDAGLKDEYATCETVIAVITRESGEGTDVSYKGSDGSNGSYLTLTENEIDVLENLAQMKQVGDIDRIVVLINSAVTVQCDFLDDVRYDIDAAMWIGLPGATGMRAVAQALVGKINPSGRLSDTLLKDNFSSPAAINWQLTNGFESSYVNTEDLGLNKTQEYYGVYVEGVYVGYRYYETRYEDYVMKSAGVGEYDYQKDVAYPFGFGKSYTEFDYSDFTVTENKDTSGKVISYDVSVKVTNVGTVAGKDVVEIYLQKPYGNYAKTFGIEKASVELVGFGKTGVIEVGESQTISATVSDAERMSIAFEQLRSYDAENAQTYILDEGDYYLTVAKNSHDAINNILSAKGYDVTDGMDEAGNSALVKNILSQDKVDKEIFSTSSARAHVSPDALSDTAVATPIVNRLDFMDPNRFNGVEDENGVNGDVVYVSRSNWLGTMPTAAPALKVLDKASEKYDIYSHKTIVEDEGATMPHFDDKSVDLTLAMMEGLKYDDPQWAKILDKISQTDMFLTLTNAYGFTPAVASVAKPLTDEDDGPYGVSNTAEGYSSMSCEGIISATFSVNMYKKVGEAIAADARSGHDEKQKNLHGLYAPGLNIHRVAFGGRAAEYFSEDPYLTGMASRYEIESMQAQGVVAHPKHFIFNDEEMHRNGICIWMNEQTAREIYLLPWEYSLRSDMGNSHALMTSFNRAGNLWTSASDDLMNKILRDEWAFDGYTLTDMAGSNGKFFMVYDDGFMNGTDLFLDKGTTSSFASEMKDSPTFNSRLRESMHRLLYVVANYSAALDGYSSLTRLAPQFVWWRTLVNSLNVISIILTIACSGMFVASVVIEETGKGKKQTPDETNE